VTEGKVPLIITLHSSAGRGDDNSKQLGSDVELLTSERVQKMGPAFVLAPQCPAGDEWINRHTAPPFHPYDLSKYPESDANRLTVAVVNDLVKRYPIDATRLYVIGYSMGGSGTWDLLLRHPNLFAAAVPITGVGDVSRACKARGTAVWFFHGDKDSVSPIENAHMMNQAFAACGMRVRYTELAGVGHGSLGPALEEPDLFVWMFAQRRTDITLHTEQ
jgi:predicted peptidase